MEHMGEEVGLHRLQLSGVEHIHIKLGGLVAVLYVPLEDNLQFCIPAITLDQRQCYSAVPKILRVMAFLC